MAVASSGEKKDVDRLVKLIAQAGYRTVPGGGGHKKVIQKNGRPVTDANGPLIISSSPSDHHWREMTVKRLMAAGVLKEDPWDSSPKGTASGRKPPNREAIEKAHAVQKAQSKVREAKTKELRALVEPIIVKLGGWEKRGLVAGVAKTAYHYMESRNRVERWKTLSACTQNLRMLRIGNTLSDTARVAWEVFFRDLAESPDPIARYMQLQREALGVLPPTPTETNGGAVALPLRVPEAHRPQFPHAAAREVRTERPIRPWTKPGLALRALYMMSSGRENGVVADQDEILRIGQEILDLELSERGLLPGPDRSKEE